MTEHEKLTQELQSGLCKKRERERNCTSFFFFFEAQLFPYCMKNESPKDIRIGSYYKGHS